MSEIHVKVCGLTRSSDVAAAVAHGAWAVGFVLWPKSPRVVTTAQVRELATGVPAGIKRVGVVVNPTVEDASRLIAEAGLTTLQLHGDEDATAFRGLGVDVIKAVSLQTEADVERAAALPDDVMVLVDAHDTAARGGTGRRADWDLAANLARRRRIILAGGLRADNVRDAIAQVAPWGIDVSSGLETAPGHKDVALMKRFFAEAGSLASEAGSSDPA